MKKHLLHNASMLRYGKFIVPALFVVLLTSGTAAAQSYSNQQDSTTQSTAVVKYVGTVNNSQLFQVQFDNEAGEKFTLSIKDADGSILFQETYQDKKFDKKFLLNELTYGTGFTFLIHTLKDNQSQAFLVNSNTHTIEDFVV